MRLKAIIFDCFGVLYVDVSKVYFAQFPDKQSELMALDVASDRGMISRENYYTAVSAITGQARPVIDAAFAHEHIINQPLITYIAHQLKPHYKIGLLSNIGRDWIQDFFDQHQLHELFDGVILSSNEGVIKPDVAIFQRSAKHLGVKPEECLMIDDTPANCDGARLADMQAILYRNFKDMKKELEHTLTSQSLENKFDFI